MGWSWTGGESVAASIEAALRAPDPVLLTHARASLELPTSGLSSSDFGVGFAEVEPFAWPELLDFGGVDAF